MSRTIDVRLSHEDLLALTVLAAANNLPHDCQIRLNVALARVEDEQPTDDAIAMTGRVRLNMRPQSHLPTRWILAGMALLGVAVMAWIAFHNHGGR
jgi:hypothetical protein